jgi:PPOX class probable F420-dependent enzyme
MPASSSPQPFTMPAAAAAMLTEPVYAHLATVQPDGSPHLTMVWIDWDGEHILVNTVEGYRKLDNMRRDPRVAIDVPVPGKPFIALGISGRVTGETAEGAADHLRTLCLRYLGTEDYPWGWPGQQRVIVRIAPEKMSGFALEMLEHGDAAN